MNFKKQIEKTLQYEQSAGYGYEEKLGGLHADPKRMLKIAIPILNYIKIKKIKKIKITDWGGGTGILLKFIKQYLEKKIKGVDIQATNIDVNPKQLKAVDKKEMKTILADLRKLLLKDIDIAISRNVYHYFIPKDQQKITDQIFKSLKIGGVFLNAFVSVSKKSQRKINEFWTDFATKANIKKEKTERFFATKKEMKKMLKKSGFKNIQFKRGYFNKAVVSGLEGLAGKYPKLTQTEIKNIEKNLLSFPLSIKKELKIKEVGVVVNSKKIKTAIISQPTYIIYGEK
jgi:ubiquinone/menaquinone biosynthesis C-methylase UbiE